MRMVMFLFIQVKINNFVGVLDKKETRVLKGGGGGGGGGGGEWVCLDGEVYPPSHPYISKVCLKAISPFIFK